MARTAEGAARAADVAGGRLAGGRPVAVADAHDERRRRDDRALRRAEHPLPAVELPQPQRDRGALRARRRPGALDGRRLALLLRRARAVLRPGRVGARGRRQPTATRSPGPLARLPDRPDAHDRLGGPRGRRRRAARLAPVSGARRDQLRAVRRARRLHVLRVLPAQRLPPGREGVHGPSRSSPARRRPGGGHHRAQRRRQDVDLQAHHRGAPTHGGERRAQAGTPACPARPAPRLRRRDDGLGGGRGGMARGDRPRETHRRTGDRAG